MQSKTHFMGAMFTNSSHTTNSFKSEHIQRAQYKLKFRKVAREFTPNVFSIKVKYNITKYLMNFLTYEEQLEFGKTCIFVLNNFIDFDKEEIRGNISKIMKRYKGKFDAKEEDICKRIMAGGDNLKDILHYKFLHNEHDNYICFNKYDLYNNKESIISLANTYSWPHKNNPMYWDEHKQIKGSYFNKETCYLNNVCWLTPNFSFEFVPKGNYKLYINQGFNVSNLYRIKNFVKLEVKINEKVVFSRGDYPNEKEINNYMIKQTQNDRSNEYKESFTFYLNNESEDLKFSSILKEQFICHILACNFDDVEPKNEENLYRISIEFFHNNDYWKSGWYLDGGRLERMTEEEAKRL